MPKLFNCDLHNHTCLSPCADLDMYPAALVQAFLAKNLDVVAICDHNASDNVEYVLKAASGTPLKVVPGMEVTTREEVHVLALFESVETLKILEHQVYENLSGENDERRFGCQAIVNEQGEVVGFNRRLLINATALALGELVACIHELGGLAIASHIDRPYFSVLSQLGFVPEQIRFDALEISAALGIAPARKKYPELSCHTFITSSDAHCLRDVGRSFTQIYMDSASFREIRMALGKIDGRRVVE